jgi:hypothetical protein
MDGQSFDKLTKTFARGSSRRQVIKGLAGGIAGALSGVVGAGRISASGGPCRPAGHPCEGGQSEQCCQDVFTLQCIAGSGQGAAERCCLPGSSVCGTGGNAICCPGEASCSGPICVCPNQREFCGFLCCPSGQVCTDAELGTCACTATSCPSGSVCCGGSCVSGNCCDATACNDGDVCTTDTCVSNQCVHTAVANCCHDATDCPASTDQCKVATCSANRCGFGNKADGTTCNDGDACTQTDTCQAGVCTGANPVVCTASDQCHDAGTCDPATGLCSDPAKADGTACNDGTACTQTDTCVGGVCTGSNPVVCTASDQCHNAGTCDPVSGTCSNPAKTNGTPCNDGLFCTTGETCQNGVCTGGTSPCDALQCLRCDEANDICVNTCPAGTQCDGSGHCVNLCPKPNQSVYCPSTTGHGFKCCPTDSVCDYRGGVVNCRNI